jgi:hypothetical protein
MRPDRIAPIEALLAQAESAHAVYEKTELNGVYDEAWPRWYAQYAVDHGIGALVGRHVTADELGRFLERGWDEVQRMDPKPTDPWRKYTARRIAEQL